MRIVLLLTTLVVTAVACPAGAKPTPKPHKPAAAASATNGWKTYTNATGLSIKYPANWTLQLSADHARLLPPEADPSDAAPSEIYLILVAGAQGVTEASDPRVAQAAQMNMSQLAPFMQVKGDSTPLSTAAAPGVVMTWEGNNAVGDLILAKAMTTIVKGYAITVMGLGKEEKIQGRVPLLQKIFASIGSQAGRIDPKLVGRWHYWSYHGSSDGNFGTETDVHVALMGDGTCAMSHKGETSGTFHGDDGVNSNAVTGSMVGTSESGDRGHWYAEGGKLFLNWNDGTIGAYEYQITGSRIYARAAGSTGKAAEWNRE